MDDIDVIFTLPDGTQIIEKKESHRRTAHFDVTDEILREALDKINLLDVKGTIYDKDGTHNDSYCIDFGRVIGKNDCIEYDPKKNEESRTVFMARRNGRDGNTPYTILAVPKNCSYLTVVLKKDNKNSCQLELITAYIGEPSPLEPWDPILEGRDDEKRKAVEYWSTHALVYDPMDSPIQYVEGTDRQSISKEEFNKKYLNLGIYMLFGNNEQEEQEFSQEFTSINPYIHVMNIFDESILEEYMRYRIPFIIGTSITHDEEMRKKVCELTLKYNININAIAMDDKVQIPEDIKNIQNKKEVKLKSTWRDCIKSVLENRMER